LTNAAHTTPAQPNFLPVTPSYDLNDFTPKTANTDFFGMGVYANPFAVNDMPMDLGSYTDTFNWVCIAMFLLMYVVLIECRALYRLMLSCIRMTSSRLHDHRFSD
jgi:hypothetical protein